MRLEVGESNQDGQGGVAVNTPREVRRCSNCEAQLTGPYCHACGQKDAEIRVPVWRLIGQVLGEVFEADGRLPRTIVPFFLKPGFLVSEYVSGRRYEYTSPLRLYIFVALVSFFLLGFIGIGGPKLDGAEPSVLVVDADELEGELAEHDPGQGVLVRPSGEPSNWFEERLFASVDKIEAMGPERAFDVLIDVYLDVLAKAVSLLLPVFALLLKVLYRRRYYSEHFIFSLNVHTVGLLLVTLATLTGSPWVIWGATAVTAVHVLLALRRVYAQSWARTILKFVLLSSIYVPIMVASFAMATVAAVLAL